MKTIRNFNQNYRKRITLAESLKTSLLTFIFSLSAVVTFAQVAGQSDQLETDKGIVAAIAPYDADVRAAILQASLHPSVLSELQKSQKETVTEFQKLIGGFSQKKQGYFYTLTRYPDLINTLATLPSGQSKDQIIQLLPNQDEDLQQAAWKLYKSEKADLAKVDNTKMAAMQHFSNSIQQLDPDSKAAFQKLQTLPDVLTLMTNNVDLTTRLGEVYKSDPSRLNNHLSALHDSLSVQNQYEIAAFKKKMAEDPQAMKEYSEAAQAYAKQNGYKLPSQQNYTNYNYYGNPYAFGNPYSYWYGYPYWYSSPMWYPGSFGFNSGFYLGTGGFGFYGFPSYGFSTWFYQGGYYRRYPHLYTQFGNYYRGNIGEHRAIGSVNHGFMGVAHQHYNPNGGAPRLNHITSPGSYIRPSGMQYQNRGGNITHPNATTFHTQSWGGYGGRGNMAGGFHGGGGFSGGGRGRH